MKKSNRRPTAFVIISTNHGTMLVNRHDYRLVRGSGYGVGYELLKTSSYEQEEVDTVLRLLQTRKQNFGDGVVAIDCGANIGVHTIEWAQFMYGWGEVISFEAQERIFYALAGNITLNNCFNARAIWAAVGAENGHIKVPVPDYFVPSSFGSLEIKKTDRTEFIGQKIDYSEDKTITTQMMSIDGLKLNRLDFIKIDIEGMEMDALKGAESSLRHMKPQLLIEKLKAKKNDIQKICKKMGYKIAPLGINLLAIHESDPVSTKIKELK